MNVDVPSSVKDASSLSTQTAPLDALVSINSPLSVVMEYRRDVLLPFASLPESTI